MDDNKNIPMEDEEVTILTLHDDEGNEEQFELLDLVDYQDKQYIVLFPVEDDDMEIVILQVEEIEGNDEEEAYVAVEDEAILDSACRPANGSRTNLSSKWTDVVPFREMQAKTAKIILQAKKAWGTTPFLSAKRNTRPGSIWTVFRFRIRIPAWLYLALALAGALADDLMVMVLPPSLRSRYSSGEKVSGENRSMFPLAPRGLWWMVTQV